MMIEGGFFQPQSFPPVMTDKTSVFLFVFSVCVCFSRAGCLNLSTLLCVGCCAVPCGIFSKYP